MCLPVAGERTAACEVSGIGIIDPAIMLGNILEVEVDKMASPGDAVGVVAGGARGVLVPHMEPVVLEALVVEDAVTAVTPVAQRIDRRVLLGVIGQYELLDQYGFPL